MEASIKVDTVSRRGKSVGCLDLCSTGKARRAGRPGSVSRPRSYDRLQAAAGRECEDRAEELADWLGQFDNGVYADEPAALNVARKF